MRLTLRNKIILSITSVIVVFGVLATISVYFYSKNVLFEQNKEILRQATINTADELALILGNSVDLVKNLASEHSVVDPLVLGDVVPNDERIYEHLEHFNTNDNYSAIYIMLPDGETIASTDKSFLGKNYSFRSYFEGAISGGTGVNLVLGVTSKKIGYYFSSKIEDMIGNVLGVAVMKMKPEVVSEYLNNSEVTEKYKFMMVDEFGVVVYSNLEERLFKSLGKLSESDKDILENERRFEGLDINPLQYQEIYDQLGGAGKFKLFEIFDEEEGEEEIMSVSKIGDYPFYIIIEQDVDIIVASARKISIVLAIFVFFAAVFAAIVIYILVYRLLRPLTGIRESVKKVSEGDYSIQVASEGGVEFEELTEAFNEMVSRVKKTKESIEKKVEERTAELKKTNQFMTGRELKMIELKKKIKELEKKKK